MFFFFVQSQEIGICTGLRQYCPFVQFGRAPFISMGLNQFISDENQAFVFLYLLDTDLF